jgi:hypothetical protein
LEATAQDDPERSRYPRHGSNRSFLVAAGLFVVVAICAALLLSRGGAGPAIAPVTTQQAATPEGRYLDALGPITDQEQAAWLAASSGFKNITDDTYDSTWITANDAATKGIAAIKGSITSLDQLRPPHQFRRAQALLLQKFRLELTLTGYVKTITAKRDPAQFFRLFGPVGRVGKANRLITPRIVQAIESAATASHVAAPDWATNIK